MKGFNYTLISPSPMVFNRNSKMPKQCQNVSTHFAIIVEIGVKTHTVSTGCLQVHQRR